MATGNLAGMDSTSNILNLINLVKGTSTTTKSNMSKEGMDAMVQQILGSVNGLGAIASGQKTAGLYGSTTQQLLTNDLVARTAGELEKQRAGTTTKTPAKLSGKDILGLGALSVGKNILGPTITGLGKKYGADKLGQTLAGSLGLGVGAAASSGGDLLSNLTPLDSSEFGSIGADLFSGTGLTDSLISFGGDLLGGIGGDIGTDVASSVAEEGGSSLLDWIFG